MQHQKHLFWREETEKVMCGLCGAIASLFYTLTSVGAQNNSLLGFFCINQVVGAWYGIKLPQISCVCFALHFFSVSFCQHLHTCGRRRSAIMVLSQKVTGNNDSLPQLLFFCHTSATSEVSGQ